PITRAICGTPTLQVWESDGPVSDPAQNKLIQLNVIDARIARNNATLTFTGDGSTIEVNVTVPTKDFFTLGGARLNADGAVQSKITFPRPAVTTDFRLQMRHPVVAS